MSPDLSLSPDAKRRFLEWYRKNRRDLPWRATRDPYAILVSEMMLQQTQVVTVIPYFIRWMERFPNFEALAAANEEEVLRLWQGLGYYRRARLLHRAASYVLESPPPTCSAIDWLSVPGIGRYTAGAVTSIAFDSPEPLVDGNVMRVYARLTADPAVKDLEKNAWIWAERNLEQESPGDWNQALMELGATVCTPKTPQCALCPLSEECRARALFNPLDFPKPKPKPTVLSLEETTIIPRCGDLLGIVQIPSGKWWEGMWQFPRFEQKDQTWKVAESGASMTYLGAVRHTVTRHRIQLAVYTTTYESPTADLRWETLDGLKTLPMPAPQLKALGLLMASQRGLDL